VIFEWFQSNSIIMNFVARGLCIKKLGRAGQGRAKHPALACFKLTFFFHHTHHTTASQIHIVFGPPRSPFTSALHFLPLHPA